MQGKHKDECIEFVTLSDVKGDLFEVAGCAVNEMIFYSKPILSVITVVADEFGIERRVKSDRFLIVKDTDGKMFSIPYKRFRVEDDAGRLWESKAETKGDSVSWVRWVEIEIVVLVEMESVRSKD